MIISNASIKGMVRTIECDALRYPTEESVDYAIRNGEALISTWYKNIIPTVGLAAIVRRLCDNQLKTSEGIATYGAIGTGTNPAVLADIKLQTEYLRKSLSVRTPDGTTAVLRMYMTTTEGNIAITEYGVFGEDASASADSGTLFERVIISKTKTSAKTLTIESRITLE